MLNIIVKKLAQRKKESQRGATAVEFAIVILVFLTIVFGIIEFGLLLYNQHIVTNAGREGARYGIVYRTDANKKTETEIEAWTASWGEQYIVTFGEKAWSVQATSNNNLDEVCTSSDEELTVEVKYNYDFLFLPFQREITTTTTMKCE